MKKSFILIAVIILQASLASAKIWRVNNQSEYNPANSNYGNNLGGTITYPVFTQVAQALTYTFFNDGDTIHLEASSTIYNTLNIIRSCTIIGGGFFALENEPINPNELNTTASNLNVDASDVKIMGIEFTSTGGHPLAGSNITIERCKFRSALNINASSTPTNGIFIRRNYFESNGLSLPSSDNLMPTNVIIQNNIFRGNVASNSGPAPITIFENNTIEPSSSSTVGLILNTGSFRNNIIVGGTFNININGGNNSNVQNNLILTGMFPGNSGNYAVAANTNPAEIFQFDSPTAIPVDRNYQLLPLPATNYLGNDGTQVGAFGGAFPYSISGVGPIPYIYEMQSTGVATPSSGLIINVSAKSSN